MSEDGGTCAYTHDLGGETWDCPHHVEEPGDERCVFHRPVEAKPAGAAAEAFREQVNRAGRRCKEFVGARFDHLDLAFGRVDAPDNHPVSLVDAHVEDRFRLTSGAVTQPLVLDGITVAGETICENATFDAECAAANADFEGGVDFQGAVFHERVRLQDATFDGPANFHAVEFDEPADFEWADFAAPADFARADFARDVTFTGARFAGTADFDSTVFGGKTDFRGVHFADRAVFRDAHFEGSTAFGVPTASDHATVEVDYHEGGRPGQSVFDFEGVLEHVHRRRDDPAEERVVADDTPHFAGEADFLDAEFVEEVRFNAPEFGTPPAFRDVTFRDPVDVYDPRVAGHVVDLRDSEIPDGTLGQRADGEVIYDLERATIGDVHIEGGAGTPFEHCRFVHTTFDGFDFGKYRDSVAAADWQIHTTLDGDDSDAATGGGGDHEAPTSEGRDREAPTGGDRAAPSRGDLEATYLKAKNGAKAAGDDKAAAEFFRQELDYRRRGYWHRLRTGEDVGERLLALVRFVANGLLKVSSGYGARPSRVVLFSFVIIGAFTPLFWLVRPEPPYPSMPRLGYLLLSFESFATGMRAGGPTLTDPWVRLLSETETFLGAFTIALFVFTLTRSINR